MAHDTDLCAALGHLIASYHLIYCPHQQAWTLVHSIGTDADDTLYEHRTHRFGPFDEDEFVIGHLRGVILATVAVRKRQFLADRAGGGPNPGAVDQEDQF